MRPSMLLRKLRQAFFPTAQMRELEKWNAAGGDEFFRFNYEHVGPDSTIVDVGGYHGQWSSDMIARYGCQAIIFEPIPAFAEFIRRRFWQNPRILIRQFALGAGNRKLKLCVEEVYSTEFGSRCDIESEVLDAADYFRQCLPSNIAAMSVNCEGGEYELLPRLIESGQIAKVKELEIQFHDFVPFAQEYRRQIRRDLMKTHREIYCYPFVWEHWKRK